jgi:hypothetical protein
VGVARLGAKGVVFAIAVLSGRSVRAEEPMGYAQFKGPAGIQVEIEGRSIGSTEGKDGLIARGLRPGARRFAAYREGFVSQFGVLMVEADVVSVQKLDAWQPVIEAAVEKDKGIGALIVDTLPVDATILARRLGWKDKVTKGAEPFVAREIPAGDHKFTFCTDDKCIDYWVHIPAAGVTKLMIDFEPGHIFNVSKEFMREWKRASAKCDSDRERSACKLACKNDVELKPTSNSPACNAINGTETTGMVAQSQETMVKVATAFDAPCDIDVGSGFLSVSSRQEVEVLIGEDSMGRTPIVRRAIPSGCHQLIAVTQDGRRHRVAIRLQPNEERRIKLNF